MIVNKELLEKGLGWKKKREGGPFHFWADGEGTLCGRGVERGGEGVGEGVGEFVLVDGGLHGCKICRNMIEIAMNGERK